MTWSGPWPGPDKAEGSLFPGASRATGVSWRSWVRAPVSHRVVRPSSPDPVFKRKSRSGPPCAKHNMWSPIPSTASQPDTPGLPARRQATVEVVNNTTFILKFEGVLAVSVGFIDVPYQDMQVQNFQGGFVRRAGDGSASRWCEGGGGSGDVV